MTFFRSTLWLRATFLTVLPFAALGCNSGNDAAPPGGSNGDSGPFTQLPPILDGGGEIPESPDGVAVCPPGICNYQTGSGCQADAPSCLPVPGNDGTLSPACLATKSAKSGEACTAGDDCAAGLLCAGGVCRKLCCGGDWNGCPTGEHCLVDVVLPVNGMDVSANAQLCFPVNQCDALDPGSCTQAGTACVIADATGATACFPAGTSSVGDACEGGQPACKGGLTCVSGHCRRLCKAVESGGDPACPAAEGRCVHYNRNPAGVGECTPT